MIESPQSFVVREECVNAASKHGYRRQLGETDGWAAFESTTATGTLHLAAAGGHGPWFLALSHDAVIDELDWPSDAVPGPGLVRYKFKTLGELYVVMLRVYQLAISLPDGPLTQFKKKTKNLPKRTDAERLVVQRIGQDIFRASLIEYWQQRCPLTGITDTPLLRASHIIPWKDCSSDAERLAIHNGFLLSALWDAAFDRGLVSFDDNGCPLFSPALGERASSELRWKGPIMMTDKHRVRLAWHRGNVFKVR